MITRSPSAGHKLLFQNWAPNITAQLGALPNTESTYLHACFYDEQGTPVHVQSDFSWTRSSQLWVDKGTALIRSCPPPQDPTVDLSVILQRYLAHENTPLPLGPP